MQIVTIDKNRKVNPNQIFVGNQYENQIESVKFDLPDYEGYSYLVINKNSESYAIPLDNEGVFYVDSLLTWRSGIYECNIVISGKELNESSDIDGTKLTFVSNTIRLKVVCNSINASHLSKAPLPINLQIVYDDLFNLYEKIKKDYEDGSFNGKDGVSPTVEVVSTETGNKVIITDKDGKKEFTVENGSDGLSAYEIAVQNGFKGTEEEWLESLRYDHSDEFTELAQQVKQDADSAASSAAKAENAMNEANKTAQANIEAINKASMAAQTEITTFKDNAVKTVQDAQSAAEEVIGNKQNEAEQAIETAKDEAIEEIKNIGVPLEDIEKLAVKENAEGNPIIISDSANWQLKKLNIYGQSEQATTTGSQLLDPSLFDTDKLVTGITYTKNEDGSIKVQ